jgi:hypothetical protein
LDFSLEKSKAALSKKSLDFSDNVPFKHSSKS